MLHGYSYIFARNFAPRYPAAPLRAIRLTQGLSGCASPDLRVGFASDRAGRRAIQRRKGTSTAVIEAPSLRIRGK